MLYLHLTCAYDFGSSGGSPVVKALVQPRVQFSTCGYCLKPISGVSPPLDLIIAMNGLIAKNSLKVLSDAHAINHWSTWPRLDSLQASIS